MTNKAIPGILLLLIMASCQNRAIIEPGKPVVSVSILPQQYFIERIAGDKVEVNVMIPPGASPATYEPTMSQLRKLHHSTLYMRIGYVGFEQGWMEKLQAANPSMKITNLSIGISLIQGHEHDEHDPGHHHRGTDPHIWMSARNARIIATNIHASLRPLLPEDADMLNANLSSLLVELDSLDHTIEELLEGLKHRNFMIYHPALSYFARDYGLEQWPLELEGKTPSPTHMKQMTELGRVKKISTIFLQTQFDQKNARVLADDIGATLVEINPLDPGWKNQMLYIANQLKTSM